MRTVLVLLAGMMLAAPVFATPSECPPGHEKIGSCVGGEVVPYPGDTTNNTNTNTNENWQAQGQAQGQIQGQIATGGNATVGDVSGGSINIYGGEDGESGAFSNTNTVDNASTSTSTATTGDNTNFNTNVVEGGAVTVGDTTLNNGGNTLIVGGGYGEEGEGSGTLNSNANAEGGSAVIEEGANTNTNTATGGNVESGAVVVENNVTVEGGSQVPTANSQTVEGDETEVNVDARTFNEAASMPVNSAPPSFAAICNSGMAGSGSKFSMSLAVTNDVCQALVIADAYMAVGQVEEAMKWVEAAARHAKWKGGLGYFRHIVTLGIL